MGQKCGKAQFHADAVPFLNLPSTAIEKLWTSFELNADGWGLSPVQFAQVCSVLAASRMGSRMGASGSLAFDVVWHGADAAAIALSATPPRLGRVANEYTTTIPNGMAKKRKR